MAQLKVKEEVISIRIGEKSRNETKEPFAVLRELITELSVEGKKAGPELQNGAVGFLTYDAVRLFEEIPNQQEKNELPEMLFNFYQNTLSFDHLNQKLRICVTIETAGKAKENYQKAQTKIDGIIQKINQPFALNNDKHEKRKTSVEVDISDEKFVELVNEAKKYIISGEAFQIVLSRCFKKSYTVSPFNIYRALRRVSPSPYMFYLPLGDSIIIGASPEKLISVRNGRVAINPIAGTRRRGYEQKDEEIEHELLNDKKEMAEHMMLVDLARNDLGAVCEPGSVHLVELSKIKHFSHVSHIASVVEGQLQQNKDAFDALKHAYPAGTLSGAPKIRAMEIIDQLETSRRGLYGGAICRLDYEGNFDSCIAIRMALLKDGLATIRTGAGIVFDSDPIAEANETRVKAASVLEAISVAQEDL
jgi:anthranilate synthase component 1